MQVSGLTGVTAVQTVPVLAGGGYHHSLAAKSDGTAWAWGYNEFGQLGDGTTTSRLLPVQVSGLSNVATVGAGAYHSLAVTGGTRTQALTYDYDRLPRLTGATLVGSAAGPTTYEYDPAGNRKTRTKAGASTSYTYDKADRITAAGGVSYTVNAAGNLAARGSDSFAYDQAHRLTSATVGGTTSTYTYDGDGKRASTTSGATTTRYVYDAAGGLPVLLDDGARKYVWGLWLAYAVASSGSVDR